MVISPKVELEILKNHQPLFIHTAGQKALEIGGDLTIEFKCLLPKDLMYFK